MAKKIRVIIKRPDEEFGHVCNVSNRLENLQNTVGGYIETIGLGTFHDQNVMIICNEEGKLLGLEPNFFFHGDYIAGTIIVVGVKADEFDDLRMSLSEWKEVLENLENE